MTLSVVKVTGQSSRSPRQNVTKVMVGATSSEGFSSQMLRSVMISPGRQCIRSNRRHLILAQAAYTALSDLAAVIGTGGRIKKERGGKGGAVTSRNDKGGERAE